MVCDHTAYLQITDFLPIPTKDIMDSTTFFLCRGCQKSEAAKYIGIALSNPCMSVFLIRIGQHGTGKVPHLLSSNSNPLGILMDSPNKINQNFLESSFSTSCLTKLVDSNDTELCKKHN